MKSFFAAAVVSLVTLASCGQAPSSSNMAQGETGTRMFSFSRDLRPVDGALVRLTITSNDNVKWTAKIVSASLRQHANIQEFSNLSCIIKTAESSLIASNIECRVDRRPVDGALTVITVTRNANNTYDATLLSSYVSRTDSQEITTTSDIGRQMKDDLIVN